jgi:nucleotide-binding universal stress UspA family protein
MSNNLSEVNEQKFSRILVPVDGSEESMHAADYAIEMARKYSAELIALNVILSDVTIFGPTIPRHIGELKQEAQNYLDMVREKTDQNMANNDDKKIPLRTELIGSASAVGGIVGFAEKDNVDLIIIGTRGRSGFTKLLLGSVAVGVVTYAHCPVMVVK